MSQYGIALFQNTTSVLRAEKLLLKAGLVIKLVPTPRQFSSDCGIAVRFSWPESARVRELLEKAGVEISGIHEL